MKIEAITPQIAALYLGQKCDVTWLYTDPTDVFLKGEVWHDTTIGTSHIKRLGEDHISIIPHLRRLESITEEEARELYKVENGVVWNVKSSCKEYYNSYDENYDSNLSTLIGEPSAWLYLLSKGFDLFGLIDAGLAKDVNDEKTR